MISAHNQELEELQQKLNNQHNRQRAELREKMNARRARKKRALTNRQDMEEEREKLEQKKELTKVQAKAVSVHRFILIIKGTYVRDEPLRRVVYLVMDNRKESISFIFFPVILLAANKTEFLSSCCKVR